ncbi:MAG TPA: folylpolyglutamate synthase/dihydrofolate synthase family protein [Candidatus Dormibacteraeota bacterium]|nr:folylpolyglutamate synthase/dihydrofolate synthase family protein [Candidatus Dormibacteraeota bacterium]
MTYEESVRYLLHLGRELASPQQANARKFDLAGITTLCEHLGQPQRAFESVHIAGTNGKGSTAAMIESILRAAGLRTGLYTSPHLERINERIRIDGREISDADFAAAFTRIQKAIEELLAAGRLAAHPTYFECMTAAAFDTFARSGVQFAVCETGMGGRLDATNILVPEVAVITQIDFDHENYLGHSIEEIATEKAGIIKPGARVVSAAEHLIARVAVRRRVAQVGAFLVEIENAFQLENVAWQDGCFSFTAIATDSETRIPIALPLAGRFQVRNALTAIAAARLLAERGAPIEDSDISRGIAATSWPGRLERIAQRPDIYMDGTHNPAGAREIAVFWDAFLPGRKIFLIYGAMRDKAVDEIAGLLFPRAAAVILTAPSQPRSISASTLANMAGHHARQLEVIPDPAQALQRALELASPEDVIFVTGSLFLVGDLRKYWMSRAGE